MLEEPALYELEALSDRLGKPLIVRSAYRSPKHNRAVGGVKPEQFDGAAFDIAMTNHNPTALEAAAREVGFLGFGFGFMLRTKLAASPGAPLLAEAPPLCAGAQHSVNLGPKWGHCPA